MMILVIHAAATWFMTGVIWFVQVVHYPLFDRVGEAAFVQYQTDHMRLTTYVVGPPMLLEAVTAGLLLFWRPMDVAASVIWANVGLLALIWFSTALLQVPRHRMLLGGFLNAPYRVLVMSNWIRTLVWTLRSFLVGWLVLPVLR